MRSSVVSLRSTPSSVENNSPSRARRMTMRLPAQAVPIESVHRLSKEQQHPIRDIYYIGYGDECLGAAVANA